MPRPAPLRVFGDDVSGNGEQPRLERSGGIVALPRTMEGRLEAAALQAQAFGSKVEQATGRPVAYWDERLTTVAAERYLIDQGKRRSKRRQEVDRMAATLLLQGYLDYQRGRGPGG